MRILCPITKRLDEHRHQQSIFDRSIHGSELCRARLPLSNVFVHAFANVLHPSRCRGYSFFDDCRLWARSLIQESPPLSRALLEGYHKRKGNLPQPCNLTEHTTSFADKGSRAAGSLPPTPRFSLPSDVDVLAASSPETAYHMRFALKIGFTLADQGRKLSFSPQNLGMTTLSSSIIWFNDR